MSTMHTLKMLHVGQSLTRIRMNYAFASHTLTGKTLDVGGGRNPDYFTYFQKSPDWSVEALDGSLNGIDFEKDPLPFEEKSIDTVILANVLEHIYNHQFLLGEIHQVLRAEGKLIGFVPFWMAYHPDPHDYFRYTQEALTRMLGDAGFTTISVHALPGGPFSANFNALVLSIPRILRPIFYLGYEILDQLFLRMRPGSAGRNPLGYVFSARAV